MDELLVELQDIMGKALSREELERVRMKIANYAMAAVMDSRYRMEAEGICECIY